MRQMKDSGIEWIGQIPQTWDEHPIYYYFAERKNKNIFGQEQNLLSLSYGKIIRKDINSTEGLLPENYNGYNIVYAGDIVMRLTDLQNDQRSLRTGLVYEKGIVTSAYVTLRPKMDLDSRYFHYLLHTFDVLKVFYNMGNGVRQGLNFAQLSKCKLIAPPLAEQERIAEFLDAKCAEMDALAGEIKEQIATLEEYKRSVITEAVTKGLDASVPMKDSGIEWIGEIPQAWDVRKGKYLFAQRNERGNNVKLQLLSPTQNYGVIPQDEYERLSGMSAVKLNENINLKALKTIHKGDYCISLRSFQGGFEYSMNEGVISPAYQVFYPTVKISGGYYKYLFKDKGFISVINSYAMSLRDGKNISFEQFGNTVIPVPPLAEQERIAEFLDAKCAKVDALIAEKQNQLATLEEYKKSVIFEYVTGKKEVV